MPFRTVREKAPCDACFLERSEWLVLYTWHSFQMNIPLGRLDDVQQHSEVKIFPLCGLCKVHSPDAAPSLSDLPAVFHDESQNRRCLGISDILSHIGMFCTKLEEIQQHGTGIDLSR